MRFLIYLLLASAPQIAVGMDFAVTRWNGHEALRLSGPIVPGDAAEFKNALGAVSAAPHGLPIVLLDSLGGSVVEALEISSFLDNNAVHMVIENGARCASACASILFVGGEYRTMETNALFGQHSCSSNGKPNQACNDLISEHAVINGVSYGSVAAFVTFVPPKDILWFSRADIDCWGISRYPYTIESSFEKSEPCAFEMLVGSKPSSQTAWRIDFLADGYRAFLRPVSDDQRELELSLWCDEARKGQLFLSVEIGGPARVIQNAITQANILAEPVAIRTSRFAVEQIDEVFSRLTLSIPKNDVIDFLTISDDIFVSLLTREPYSPIEIRTRLSGSRNAAIFAANNCLKQRSAK